VTRECQARFYERRRVRFPPPTHHRVKHRGGWRVEQPDPGTFIWSSPLGGEYRITAEPIIQPMPDPTSAMRMPDPLDDSTERLGVPILYHPAQARAPAELPYRP
jgi:hypothetical protein